MTRIYYWQDAIGSSQLLDEHAVAIQRLLSGSYAARDLEKLQHTAHHSTPIYSFRLNKKARLLFTTHEHYLLVLEYLPTHDYQNSRYLKRKVKVPHFEMADRLPTVIQSTGSLEYQPVDYFNGQFLQLSIGQQSALQTRLPLIISGVAGSGKTFVALALLRQILEQRAYDAQAQLVYVSKEPELVQYMQQVWLEFHAHTTDSKVEFMTYHAWLNLYQPLASRVSDDAYYQAWSASQKPAVHGLDAQTEFQEFRMCAALTDVEYLALGANQSACPIEKRALLYANFQRFMAAQRVVDPVFYRLDHPPVYDCIVVDEAQNLSLIQQDNLYRLAKDHAVAFCMDSHQNLIDQCAMQTLLRTRYWTTAHDPGMHSIYLANTYRCSPQVVGLVNQLLQAQYTVMGKIDKQAASVLEADARLPAGAAYLTTPETLLTDYGDLLDRAVTTDFAVVTRAEHVDNARELFQTPLVFTIEQIQGLGYDTVVVYQLWDHAPTRQSLERIHACLGSANSPAVKLYKAKNHNPDVSLRDLAPLFNQAYTAYTRAQRTLLICENPALSSRIKHHALLQWLARDSAAQPSHLNATVDVVMPSNQTAWDAERERLVQRGQHIIAERITQRQQNVMTLWENFSQPGVLLKFIQQSDFIQLLLYTPLPQSPSLFCLISQSDNHWHRFIVVMNLAQWHSLKCQHKIAEVPQLSPLVISQLIQKWLQFPLDYKLKTWIASRLKRPAVRASLCQLLRNEEDIFALLTALVQPDGTHPLMSEGDLASLLSLQNKALNSSLFTLLSKAHVLRIFFLKNTVLAKKIPISIWIEALMSCIKKNSSVSLFYGLCADMTDKSLFLLLAYYPDIVRAIPLESWITPVPLETIRDGYLSPLYLLSQNELGQKLLGILVERYPDLINAIPVSGWMVLPPAQSIHAEKSFLYWLAITEQGRAILRWLLENYPALMRAIPAGLWSVPIPTTYGRHSQHMTPLYWLCTYESGVNVLIELLDNYPDVFLSISGEIWGLEVILSRNSGFFSQAQGEYLYSSAWAMLSTTPAGQAFICRLMREAPELIQAIPVHAWTRTLWTIPGNSCTQCALTNLMVGDHASEFFDLLFEDYQALYQRIPDTFWQPYARPIMLSSFI
jgi:hypothetical protein